jgi:hypothetical protein
MLASLRRHLHEEHVVNTGRLTDSQVLRRHQEDHRDHPAPHQHDEKKEG